MAIPLGIVALLPRKWRDKYIQQYWDTQPEEFVLTAYDDATGWIEQLNRLGIAGNPVLLKLRDKNQYRLDELIIPQMKKRNLMTCKCQDSAGVVCGKIMTPEEKRIDNMCEICAGHVWDEMQAPYGKHHWKH